MFGLAAISSADRLFFIPTGTRLNQFETRIQSFFSMKGGDYRRTYLGVGLFKLVDLEFTETRSRNSATVGSFDLGFNYIVPIPDLGPGISFGVQDVLNRTPEGRSSYIAVTWKVNNDNTVNADTPLELTIGGGTGHYRGAFVGVRLPLYNGFRIVAEHDSRVITAGLEVALFHSDLRAHWLVRDRQSLAGLSYSMKF